ncbi:MAG TPA: PCP reductase family protein, partial [Thermoanaerobaculia bacterium]|nr:PCP reductase family protein [Thermoanaerobaculia bacterium]
MKFLCIACDQPMKLERTAAADGSITAVFRCPRCEQGIAMLTNPWETQVVQSLGVQLGGQGKESRCPFGPAAGSVAEASPTDPGAPAARATAEGMAWTAGALARLERIPDFVRPMARQGIEHFARDRGRTLVTEEVLEEARGRLG